jgi:hypothetical protein
MRYAKQKTGNEMTIVTEDGGVVTVHHNGTHMITTYYQDRVEQFDENMWEELDSSKQYLHDWKGKQEVDDEIVQDALEWLSPMDNDFVEEDYYLFTTEFNHQQNKRRADQ